MAIGKNRVTLKDIAEKTGYSINTISHALHDKPDISPKTKEQIKAVAEEMGYIANALASSMRSGVSKTIAVIVGDISNPHFAIMVKEIEAELRKRQYTVLVLNTDEQESLERQAIVTALNKNVDGILICPCPNSEKNMQFLASTQVPFVLIGRHLLNADYHAVVCDDVKSGYLATKYLLEQGHREILFLNGNRKISSARERQEGYERALLEYGLEVNQQLIHHVQVTMGAAQEKIKRILKQQTFSAVLAFSDMLAWEVLDVLVRMGYQVPEHYSVVGFDNIQSKYPFPIPLTTVSSSKITMARQAVEVLLKSIDGALNTSCKMVLDTKLVKRGTVGKK